MYFPIRIYQVRPLDKGSLILCGQSRLSVFCLLPADLETDGICIPGLWFDLAGWWVRCVSRSGNTPLVCQVAGLAVGVWVHLIRVVALDGIMAGLAFYHRFRLFVGLVTVSTRELHWSFSAPGHSGYHCLVAAQTDGTRGKCFLTIGKEIMACHAAYIGHTRHFDCVPGVTLQTVGGKRCKAV